MRAIVKGKVMEVATYTRKTGEAGCRVTLWCGGNDVAVVLTNRVPEVGADVEYAVRIRIVKDRLLVYEVR